MAKFQFKLETVLKVKVRIEDLRKKELKEAEVRREQARRQLLRRQEEVAQTVKTYREQFERNFDIFIANDYHKFLTWLNKQVDLAVLHLQKCDYEVAETRRRLVEAAKERKILEKLKEKAYQEFQAEELKREADFLDEIGTERFVRLEGNDRGGSSR